MPAIGCSERNNGKQVLRWFLVVGFLVLAACQQAPAGSGSAQPLASSLSQANDQRPSDWGTSGVALDSKYFAADAIIWFIQEQVARIPGIGT
jgi:hypothetical protein